MSALSLGRMQRVSLREIWSSESGHFTPWLASGENIALLGDALDLDLEVEGREKNVGPFRADILCKDTLTNAWVLIENQLEKTDHGHLGQLLTYAANLEAVTIVWIAERFCEEHRATLDWLNEITDDRFNFFGLEIELWRIGSSPVAPKFNVISRPNWTKKTTKDAGRGQLTGTRQLQLDYWTSFRAHLEASGSFLRAQKPLPQSWTLFAIGRSYFHLCAAVNTRDGQIYASLVVYGPNGKEHFAALYAQKDEIESVTGALEWRELPEKKESQIVFRRPGCDPTDTARWPDQHEWLRTRLELLHRAFAARVSALDVEGAAAKPL